MTDFTPYPGLMSQLAEDMDLEYIVPVDPQCAVECESCQ
jgi:hypothetical protein